jgi:hypothetical protein
MADAQDMAPPGPESAAELRDLLSRMLIERLNAQETKALADGDLERYRQLNARKKELQASLEAGET